MDLYLHIPGATLPIRMTQHKTLPTWLLLEYKFWPALSNVTLRTR